MVFILIYIALVIVRPQEYPQLADLALPLLPGTLAVAAVAWLVAGRKTFAQPQYPLLLAFFGVTMISIAVNGWVGGAIEQAGEFAPAVVAFVLLANALTTRRRMIAVMQVFVLCACVLALHGVLQAQNGIGWTGMPLSEDNARIQYIGIFSDPNDLGLLFVSVLPFAFHLAGRGGMLGLVRLIWLAAAALLLYGVYLTNSRGAMLGVASMVGVWVWLRRGMITAIVVAGGGFALLQMLPSRLQDLDAGEESAAGRVDAWYEGLQMLQSQPVFGVGAHNFTDHNYLTAHNSFVLVLAETGIVGYTIWLAFVGYGFRMMWAICRYTPMDADPSTADAWRAELGVGTTLFVSLCGFFTAAFFLSRSYVIVLYLFAAMVVAQYTLSRERFPGLPEFRIGNDLVRWGLTSVGSVALLYVIVRVLL